MKTAITILALAIAFAAAPVLAADAPSKALTPQQQRMKDCNGQATDKKGEERRAFMSTCLKGGTTTAATPEPVPQPAKKKSKSANAAAH
jgi:hypothetical protein